MRVNAETLIVPPATIALLSSVKSGESPLLPAVPCAITVEPDDSNSLRKPSQIMVDRAVTVPRGKVGTVFGRLDHRTLSVVDVALARFLGLGERVA